ncbi:MAG TPA: hypothetical protein VKX41_15820 [Alloacidobacterium sp.]|nr:hypothetical protein [Alloacidobacterium sp.]
MSSSSPPQPGANPQSAEAIAARKALQTQIEKQQAIYNLGTVAWSAIYNSCLIGAAILSAAAAIVVKVDAWKAFAVDTAAICAGLSALLNSLNLGGGFDRKWRANRAARSKIKQLLVDISDPTSDMPTIRSQFKQIVNDEDIAIMGHP